MPDVVSLLAEIADIGRDPAGGYRRFALTAAEAELGEWFTATAQGIGLDVEVDRNGNRWAWWGQPGPGAVVTGSHLDSVPRGGALDGPLGVASALAAVARLRDSGIEPRRPLAVACFADEEGGRFGVACLGSRLATGAIAPERALALRDAEGITMAEAMRIAGHDPERAGAEPERLAGIAAFVEVHVEQGRALAPMDAALGIGARIWPHGRWRLDIDGRADHAGTTRMADRIDPMVVAARVVQAARARAAGADADEPMARATIGRIACEPNAVNAVPARVSAWLDARARDESALDALVEGILGDARACLAEPGGDARLEVTEESRTPVQRFDADLSTRIREIVGDVPVLDSGAGHDAGILADAGIPSAMLFVRNPTGISHSPEECAADDDCRGGVDALAAVLAGLIADPGEPR